VPEVDFRREVVVTAASGSKVYEDEFRIDSIGVTHQGVTVIVIHEKVCGPFGDVRTWGEVQVVRVPRRVNGVRFVERLTGSWCMSKDGGGGRAKGSSFAP
jgi:hypothetical protein